MRVSVLISNYNRGHLFERTALSLIDQLTYEDEIVVVTDSTGDVVMEKMLKIINDDYKIPTKHYITGNTKYRSCVVPKNVALKSCQNELIIINDPEVYHVTKCIEQIKEHIKQTPRGFVVPGTMRFGVSEVFDLKRYRTIEKSQAPFIGGVLRQELLSVGGWDERFKYWGNDDNDLMYRLGRNGVNHIVDESMIAYHQYHDRPPNEALGPKDSSEHCNHHLLNEPNKKIVANEGLEWGKL